MSAARPETNGSFPGQQTVRCLDCGALYRKPASGGTVSANPGCPDCGYVGWALDSRPASAQRAPERLFTPQRRKSA